MQFLPKLCSAYQNYAVLTKIMQFLPKLCSAYQNYAFLPKLCSAYQKTKSKLEMQPTNDLNSICVFFKTTDYAYEIHLN
jgi:hypothetical protein